MAAEHPTTPAQPLEVPESDRHLVSARLRESKRHPVVELLEALAEQGTANSVDWPVAAADILRRLR